MNSETLNKIKEDINKLIGKTSHPNIQSNLDSWISGRKSYDSQWNPFEHTEFSKENKMGDLISSLIELVTNHKPISQNLLDNIQKNETIKCMFMALIKQHYSTEEMEKFLKKHKGFLDSI